MLALGFTNLVFLAYITYILLERKTEFYKSNQFWLMLLGLCLSLYITAHYLMPVSVSAGGLTP